MASSCRASTRRCGLDNLRAAGRAVRELKLASEASSLDRGHLVVRDGFEREARPSVADFEEPAAGRIRAGAARAAHVREADAHARARDRPEAARPRGPRPRPRS